jgi:hypothetical protein
MRIRRKSDGKWVEIPDGPTPEEELETAKYKLLHAGPWMQWFDQRPKAIRDAWNEDGRPR